MKSGLMDNLRPDQIEQIVRAVVERVSASMAQGASAPAAPSQPTPPSVKDENTATGKRLVETGATRMGITDAQALHCDSLAPYIDHTLLKPNATEDDIAKLCGEARQYNFASVCVNTSYVEQCARLLGGSPVKVCTVVGFPLGAMSSAAKAFETRDAVSHGAEEIDMVINVGKLQSGNYAYVLDDIRAVVESAGGRTVKVIIETGLLSENEKVAACVLAKAAGSDFVKTSTGFSGGGATEADIALMRSVVGGEMGVKASGGIRDCAGARNMIAQGATRIGASASVNILKGDEARGKAGY